jgi:hypothetical protein
MTLLLVVLSFLKEKQERSGCGKTGGGGLLSRLGIAKSALKGSAQPQQKIDKRKTIKNPYVPLLLR